MRPSINVQISTGIGGTFLGEALFRMSSLWLEKGTGCRFWRELVVAAISPPVGFNRLVFGERFNGIFPSNAPEYYSAVQVGTVGATQDHRQPSGALPVPWRCKEQPFSDSAMQRLAASMASRINE